MRARCESQEDPSGVPGADGRRFIYGFKGDPSSSHATILRFIGQGRGRRLLDVGAADGFLAERFAEQGWAVTAIEQDPELASCARRHCSEVVVSDLNNGVPQLTGSFDAMVYGDVLEHLASPELVLRDLNRHLKKDGMVIVSVPNVAHLWVRLMILLGRFEYADRGILDRTHLRFFTLKTFRQLLEQGHVHLVELVPVPAPLALVVPPRFHGAWLRWLQKVHAFGARCWPAGLAYQFVARGYGSK